MSVSALTRALTLVCLFFKFFFNKRSYLCTRPLDNGQRVRQIIFAPAGRNQQHAAGRHAAAMRAIATITAATG